MKRIGLVTKLKPEMADEYFSLHNEIWPKVVKNAHDANIRNYTIFRKGLYLLSYFEYIGNNYEEDMKIKNSKSETIKWQQTTGKCLDPDFKEILFEGWHDDF